MRFFTATAVLGAVGLAVTWSETAAWAGHSQTIDVSAGANAAVWRALHLLVGARVPAWFAAVAVVAAALVLVHARARPPAETLAVACWASVFVLPRVWAHSLCILLPSAVERLVEAGAAIRDHRTSPEPALRAVVSILAVSILAVSDPLCSLPMIPPRLQGINGLLPCVAGAWLVFPQPSPHEVTRRAPVAGGAPLG
jgi:hypothetical protein